MEFWIAKDKDGMVYLFEEMPYKKDDYFYSKKKGKTVNLFEHPLWANLTFENSPQKVKIELCKCL